MSPAAARPGTSGRGRISATMATETATGLRRLLCAPVQPDEPVSRRHLTRIGAAIAAALLVGLALRAAGAMTAVTALQLEAVMALLVWLVFGRRISVPLLPRPQSTHDR